VSGITEFLEGFAKIDEGSRGLGQSKSQVYEFPGKKFVASDPQSQVMSRKVQMRIIIIS